MQCVNGWFLIDGEEDQSMIEHASKPTEWHQGFARHLITDYFSTGRRRVAIDVGASYGWMTTVFAVYFDEVHAFEVRDDVRECLKLNVPNLNVMVHEFGLSDHDYATVIEKRAVSGTTAVHRMTPDGMHVDLRRMDDLELQHVDLIKLDVERHEAAVLRGSTNTIREHQPIVVAELDTGRSHHARASRHAVLRIMHDLDYRMVDINHRDAVFVPMRKS